MPDWNFRKLLPALALSLMVGLAGCEMFNGDDDDDDGDLRDERISRDGDADSDTNGDRSTAGRYNTRVPESATLMNDWVNNELAIRPSSDGTVYILSEGNDLLYSGRIDEGQRFLFDRRTGLATIDGRTVFSRDLPGTQKYRVFVDRR